MTKGNKEGRRATVTLRLSERATNRMREYAAGERMSLSQGVSQFIENAVDADVSDLEGLRGEIEGLKEKVKKLENEKVSLSRSLESARDQGVMGSGTYLVPHRR